MVILGLIVFNTQTVLADGNVQVRLTGNGSLKIIGDNEDNRIRVTNNGSGIIRVVPIDGTTINEGPDGTDISGTTSNTIQGQLSINLRGGDNTLEIDEIAVNQDLKIIMKQGDNTLDLSNAAIGNNVSIRMGAGNNFIRIDNILVNQQLGIGLTNGQNTIGLFNTIVSDDVSLETGTGNDLVALAGDTSIADRLNINTSDGNDRIEIAECVTVSGRTDIQSKAGDDIVDLRGIYFDSLKLNTGTGTDELYISDYTNSNRLNIKLGNDNDIIEIVAASASFGGRITINGGSGNNDHLIRDTLPSPAPRIRNIESTDTLDLGTDILPSDIRDEFIDLYVIQGGDALDISCDS